MLAVTLKDITPQMVEAAYAAIREERGLSGTSMNRIHQLLKSVFQKAIDYDYIYKNPCAHVVAPRRDDPKRGSLTIEEGARLMGEVDKAEAEAYAQIDEKEARRAYREEHGIARKRNAFRGLHHIGNITAARNRRTAWQKRRRSPPKCPLKRNPRECPLNVPSTLMVPRKENRPAA